MFSTVDSENELKVESALEQLIGSFYEDLQGDASGYGFDLVANNVQWPHLNNKRNVQERVLITQTCCRNPCTIHVLTQFCPRRQ